MPAFQPHQSHLGHGEVAPGGNASRRQHLLFHGTRNHFRQFREAEEGIFFCESVDMAAWYGDIGSGEGLGRVIAAHLDIKAPLIMSWREYLCGVTDSGINHYLEGNEGLEARGYDGLILTDPDEDDPAMASVTHVAFHPDQVKVVSWDWKVKPSMAPRGPDPGRLDDGPCP